MGRLIDIDILFDYFGNDAIDKTTRSNIEYFVSENGTVEAIPKADIQKAIDKVEEYICDHETNTVKAQGMAQALDIFEQALGEIEDGNAD